MPPKGFEPAFPASARPQTYTLDCAATGIGISEYNILLLLLLLLLLLNGKFLEGCGKRAFACKS
jgi:hypothetical protein